MASGSSVPPARVRPLPSARPGAVLAAAAAVPLGVAVLYASGWLAWGPRLALGVAVVVLGQALRGTVGSVTGARITVPVARTVGLAFLVGAALIALGALLAAVGVDRPASPTEVGVGDGPRWTLVAWAVPVVGLVASGLTALTARYPAALRSVQEPATACAVVSGLGVLVLAERVATSSALAAGEPVLNGTARVAAVLLLVALALGTVLLATAAARLPSRPAVAGTVVGTVGVALWAATVSVATTSGVEGVPADAGWAATLLRPLDLVLGFGDAGRLLHGADPAWPVLFGIVGLVLAAAGAWLESRRPVPADAPVAVD